jgi:hypothetical protein
MRSVARIRVIRRRRSASGAGAIGKTIVFSKWRRAFLESVAR